MTLCRMTWYYEFNKLTLQCAGVIFGPVLFRTKGLSKLEKHERHQCGEIVEMMIEECETLFPHVG